VGEDVVFLVIGEVIDGDDCVERVLFGIDLYMG